MATNNHSLGDQAARKLANTVKTPPQFSTITPRWFVRLLDWKALESGTLRVNRVKENTQVDVLCGQKDEQPLPESFVDYEVNPREYTLSAISTVLEVHTRVSDLYSSPNDQIKEQIRLTIEGVKERQELELFNNDDYGLLKQTPKHQRISTRKGPPTPDDLDELITKVWKEPSFFLAHPLAVAAFGRECTKRGVPPATVSMFGAQFLTWRGLPIIPTDKLLVDGKTNPGASLGKTNIVLLRVGEKKQGVVGLYQQGLPGEQTPGLSVRFMGINQSALSSYLISLYCSAAIFSDDAIGILENVDVGNYHEYK